MKIVIVGAGPAGLRAAEIAAATGAEVTVCEAKASVGRKFLVAGRGGLNLAKLEPAAVLATRYLGAGMPADAVPLHCIEDVDRVFDDKSIADAGAITARVAIANHAAGKLRSDKGEAAGNDLGAATSELVNTR